MLDSTIVTLLALFYGTVVLGVVCTALYLTYRYFKDKASIAHKKYKRRHLKYIPGGKRDSFLKKR